MTIVLLAGMGCLVGLAAACEWRRSEGLAAGFLLASAIVAGWGGVTLLGNGEPSDTTFVAGKLIALPESATLGIWAEWRVSPERLAVVSLICVLAACSLQLQRWSWPQHDDNEVATLKSLDPLTISITALLATSGVLADDWFLRLGLLSAGVVLVSSSLLLAQGAASRWFGILLPVLMGDLLLATTVWSAGTTAGGFSTGRLFERSGLRSVLETHPEWLTLWGLGLVAGLYARTQQFPLTWQGPFGPSTSSSAVTQFRAAPLQLWGIWLPGLVMLREGQSWLVGLTASPQLPVALGSISWGLLGLGAFWQIQAMNDRFGSQFQMNTEESGHSNVIDSKGLALGMGLVGSLAWMESLSGPIPLVGLVGLAACLASLGVLQILVASGGQSGQQLLLVVTAITALLGLRGLVNQPWGWLDALGGVAPAEGEEQSLATWLLPGLYALGCAGASGHLIGFLPWNKFAKSLSIPVKEDGRKPLVVISRLLTILGSLACGSLCWDSDSQSVNWPEGYLLVDAALLAGGLAQVTLWMTLANRPLEPTSSLALLATACERLFYRDAFVVLLVKLPLLATGQLVRFADWLVVDMLGWGSIARLVKASGRLTLAQQHGYWPWYAVLMLVMLTAGLWSVL